MRIVIAVPTLISGDAVGHDVIEQYRCLKEEGIDAYIFAKSHIPETAHLINADVSHFLKDKNTILIYHHAIYWEQGSKLLRDAKCRKVIKYHNITPEYFFLPYLFSSSNFFMGCLLGRRQNHELANMNIDMIFSDSSFNAKDFLDIGFPKEKIKILPPFHKTHDFDNTKNDIGILDKLLDGKINVFFCGRVVPNKGHKHILYTAYYYKLLFGDNIRFVIAGGLDPRLKGYSEELIKLRNSLKINDIAEFTGSVSFEQLKSYYSGSHVFLLLSEHEGFCVPILESQYLKLPVIAYNSSAISETLGKNQVGYDIIDYESLAASIYTLYNDIDLRGYLIEEGYKNFLKYERVVLKESFINFLKGLE